MTVEFSSYKKLKTDGTATQKHFKININTSWNIHLIKNAVLIILTVVDIASSDCFVKLDIIKIPN